MFSFEGVFWHFEHVLCILLFLFFSPLFCGKKVILFSLIGVNFIVYLNIQDALEPYLSRKALEMHWGVHHRDYVESLNKQLETNDPIYGYTIEEMVKETYNSGNPLPEFNNVAEVGDRLQL